MQIAQTTASKALVAVVAAAMMFSAFVAPAKAATVEELQAQITALMAQIAALSGQGGTSGSVASGICPFTWTMDLKMGSTGADVMKLQQFLNANADTRVAASGAGSVGAETQYYGPATAAAVSKFQVMHRADILTPSGLTNPTGFFGPSTRAKANALCTTSTTPTTPGEEEEETTELSGEADLTDYTADDADDDTVEEGQEEAEVAVFTATFENGDAEISRLDISFDGSDSNARPWDMLDTVSLWVDGEMVAEADASSKNDYLGDEANGIIRFSNLDIVAMEDEDLEITVAVNMKSGLDTEELSSTWTVTTESLRFFDADGVATTDETLVDDESATFTVEEEGVNDGAEIKKNTDNPGAATLKVEDDSKTSDKYEIFTFNVEVDEDSADLELGNAYVDLTVTNPSTASTTTTVDDVIDTVELTIDGKTVKGKATSGTANGQLGHVIAASNDTNTVTYTFDFKNHEFTADEVYEAVVEVSFKGQNTYARYQNNVTVAASVDGSTWEMESMTTGDYVLSKTQSSKTMTLATVVPEVTGVDSKISQANNQSNSGSIIFEFKVAATDDDVVVTRAQLDAVATLISSASTTLAKPTPSLSKISGDATESPANTWTIEEGDDATFRLTYTFTTASAHNNGDYSINLDTIAGVEVDETSPVLPLAHN